MELSRRIAELDLPFPLEFAIARVLAPGNPERRHEELVHAWETTTKIIASAMWAVCRQLRLRSDALDSHLHQLERPSFGHWTALVRTARPLLKGRTEPEADILRPLLQGLDRRTDEADGLRRLRQRIESLPDEGIRLRGPCVYDLLEAMSSYRNAAQSTHRRIEPAFRKDSIAPLLEGLLDLCEVAPLLGNYRVVVVHRREPDAPALSVEFVHAHGRFITMANVALPEATWRQLVAGRPYLYHAPQSFVPLFPMVAAEWSDEKLDLGWLAAGVRQSLAYQGERRFTVPVATEDYESLLGRTRDEGREPIPAEALEDGPWRGLSAYETVHAPLFFGRTAETETAVSRLEEKGALILCGATGCGKSSLMKAGIVPELQRRTSANGRELLVLALVPGSEPLAALRWALLAARQASPEAAAAWSKTVAEFLPADLDRVDPAALTHLLAGLANTGRRVLLCIDQLEEVATLARSAAGARRFLDVFASAVHAAREVGARVVATVRADLVGKLLDHEGFRRAFEQSLQALGPIESAQLRQVITEPLRGCREQMEPGLPETIFADVAEQPGAIALLSQVLRTLWAERAQHGYQLTKQGYAAAGGVKGAVERQAEAAREESLATGAEKGMLDRALCALAKHDAEHGFSRRRVPWLALAESLALEPDALRGLLDPFVKRRLLVLSADPASMTARDPAASGAEVAAASGSVERATTVEVAHETLLEAWPYLRDLLQGERERIALRQEIEASAAAWEDSGRQRELWSDATSRLVRAEEELAAGRLALPGRERAFLAASRARVHRRRRVERIVGAALAVLVVLTGVGFVMARANARTAQANLDKLIRLSSSVLLDHAREREKTLHPPWPGQIKAMQRWLDEDSEAVRDAVPQVSAELADLRARTPPFGAEEREASRRVHTRYAELVQLRAKLEALRRAQAVRDGNGEPLPYVPDPSLDQKTAEELNTLAWPLVDPDRTAFGREAEGLALAQRAVANTPDQALILDTLAWAWFCNGKNDEARATMQDVLKAASPDMRAHYEVRVRQLTAAIDAAQGEKGRAQIAHLSDAVEDLEGALVAWQWTTDEDQLLHNSLARVLPELRSFEANEVKGVKQRIEWAKNVRPLTITRFETQWAQARAAIAKADGVAASELYRRDPPIDLKPQMGLVPIGMNPKTKLWEFYELRSAWDLESGQDPAAIEIPVHRDDGSVDVKEGTGIVFVLLPGGTFRMGAQDDPLAEASETPHDVTLDAFFLARHELTRAQWRRLSGGPDLSANRLGSRFKNDAGPIGLTHPVENVNWAMCHDLLGRWGLVLPTEAQWEYGCRAGKATRWWTGEDASSLGADAASGRTGAANVLDLKAFRADHRWGNPDGNFDDGWIGSAPVGSYRANPWGLFDVHGNLWEWALDAYSTDPPRAGDGLRREGNSSADRVTRGGSFRGPARYARASYREAWTPELQAYELGLRAARLIQP